MAGAAAGGTASVGFGVIVRFYAIIAPRAQGDRVFSVV